MTRWLSRPLPASSEGGVCSYRGGTPFLSQPLLHPGPIWKPDVSGLQAREGHPGLANSIWGEYVIGRGEGLSLNQSPQSTRVFFFHMARFRQRKKENQRATKGPGLCGFSRELGGLSWGTQGAGIKRYLFLSAPTFYFIYNSGGV